MHEVKESPRRVNGRCPCGHLVFSRPFRVDVRGALGEGGEAGLVSLPQELWWAILGLKAPELCRGLDHHVLVSSGVCSMKARRGSHQGASLWSWRDWGWGQKEKAGSTGEVRSESRRRL